MEMRELLSRGTSITFLEIAGHGTKVLSLIPDSHIDPTHAGFNSPEAIKTRQAIATISARMSQDAEIRLAGCKNAQNERYMKLLAAAFRRKVSGNRGTVFVTGAGEWKITDEHGTCVDNDTRWGSFPYPAMFWDWVKRQ